MATQTILQSEFVTQLILPFLLVFTLIFAILDRTKILGEDKRQINAIVAFVVGLMFVSFGYAIGITIKLIAVMAVIAVILLVFMILFGFASTPDKEFKMPNGLKITFGILIGIALVVALLVITGYWNTIISSFSGSGSSTVASIIFIIIIVGAALVVIFTGKKKD